jgi:hypothetical protein
MVFDVDGEVQFAWHSTGTAVIALVLSHQPRYADDLLRYAVWGAALDAKHPPSVTWDEGQMVVNQTWQASRPSPPTEGDYFLVVQAVSRGSLKAISAPVPFAIGESNWKAEGDSCDTSGIPGDCYNPSVAAGCIDGICRRLCASSFADCKDSGVCEPPDSEGRRVCAL